MNFRFTAEQEAFRADVRAFLAERPPSEFPLQSEDDGYGYGGWSHEFARHLGAKGWISLIWPKEYGGQGRPMMDLLILMEELAYLSAPTNLTIISEPMARTIIAIGNDFLKRELLPGIARGEISFWQALSEPQAGSDLLGLQTRAEEDGDYFVVNGQKTWSTMAHEADFGFLMARTDPDAPRHKGLSMFVLDKNLPGVTVRPMANLAGALYHSQVFLDNVRVPKQFLLGEKNNGFAQMLAALEADRFWARFLKPSFCKGVLEQLIHYCKETRRDGVLLAADPTVRHKLAESAIEVEACRQLFYRTAWMMQQKMPLTYQATAAKLMADEMGQRLYNKGMQIMGPFALLGEGTHWAPLRGKFQRWCLLATGHTLAGGASEVLRTNIATFGMKLPRA